MKISYNWLRSFLPTINISPQEIGEKLTLHTAELEEIIEVSKNFENIFLGKLLEIRSHKNSEKLSVGIFDLGEKIGKKQIIYGQVHPVSKGEIFPIALDGALLKSGIEIKNSEIRGEKSEGMICDNLELGFSFEGLFRFSDEKLIGNSLVSLCDELNDVLFDIDNKSLTHRPDLMGVRGFALEISAIFDEKLMLPEPLVAMPKGELETIKVNIQTKKCRRFCALKMGNVEVKDSDFQTQVRLENLEIRAISNLVDITNLILLEFGQPMHVFDADKVVGEIFVRNAKNGESLVALDGNKYELNETDLVIADEEKVLSIAGVMGGAFSSVNTETKKIIFECANFDPMTIRKTSQRLGLRSESSMRYEKSLDAEKCKRAIFSAIEKVLSSCPKAKIKSILTDEYPIKNEIKSILLDPDLVRKKSGINISDKEIKEILEKIDFKVYEKESQNKIFKVIVPSFRATKDINIAEDLIEEVVRLYGFFNVKAQMPTLPATPPRRNFLRDLEWKIKDFLAYRGFLEVYNYSFVNESDETFTGQKDYVKIANPLSLEQTQLRKTLLSNLVKNLESELRIHGKTNLFEFGHVYESVKGQVLPKEALNFILFSAEIGGNENEKFYEIKDELNHLFLQLGIFQKIEILPLEEEELKFYFHPTKSAKILCDGEKIGEIAVLHPQFLPIKKAHIVFAEVQAEKVLKFVKNISVKYQKITSFPSVYRDLSIVLDAQKHILEIEKHAKKVAPFLQKIELFDEYEDEQKLGKGLKNLAFHLTFKSSEKTLEEKEIESNFLAIVKVLDQKLGAKLRLDFDKSKNS